MSDPVSIASFSSLLNKVHLGQSPEFLKQLPDDIVSLTLTSPPYYDDDLYTLDDKSPEFGWTTYEEYLKHLYSLLDELYRITIPGGYCVFVLSNSPQTDNEEYISHYWPIPHDLVSYAYRHGWEMQGELIWVKKQDMYPYIKQRNIPDSHMKVKHDIITVLRKPGPRRQGTSASHLSSVWHLKPRGPIKSYNNAYPSFPNTLVRRIIRSWSLEEDIVLDPYAGSGQVCRLAIKMNRFTLGVEMDEQWKDLWQDINS